jgi:hypothetical protein
MLNQTGQTARKIMTVPALLTTIAFIVLDFVVSWLGELAAARFKFDESLLVPGTFLICVAAGYTARNRGAYGMMAGALVTTIEAVSYIVTGHITEDVGSTAVRFVAGWILVLIGIVGGGIGGALGDWIAQRRGRTVTPVSPLS